MIGEFEKQSAERRNAERICWEIVESVNSIILRWDTSLKITFANEFALKFFGFRPGDLVGQSIVGTILPAEGNAGRDLAAMVQDIVERPERYVTNENENVRRDGTRVWIYWTNRAIRDPEGRVVEILSVGNDITDRKHAEEELQQRVLERTRELERANESLRREVEEHRRDEEALRESEERFRATFEQAAVGIGHVALDGRFIRVNRRYCEIVGYPCDELTGLTYQQITYPPDAALDREIAAGLLEGRQPTYTSEKRYVRKDGSLVWVNMTVSLVRDREDRPKYYIAVVRDIADRKRAEEALRESEERFRATFEQAAVGIAHMALDGHYIRCNQKFCDIVRRDCVFLTGHTFRDITGPEDLPRQEELDRRLQRGEIDKYSIEKRYIGDDGALIWANLTVSLVLGADGQPKYFMEVIEDIGERMRAEEALKRARARAELYLDLMGHDISNMNQAMMGYLEIARGTLDMRGHEELIDRPLEIIRHSSKLIGSVKKLEHAQSGRYPPKMVDLGPVLRDVAVAYATVPGRDVRVRYAPVAGCYVRANELLKDVFDHLVENAVRHSQGPLEVDVSVKPVLQDGRRYYRVDVADNGPGIPDDLKKRVFRFVDVATGIPGRRGLGLYMVRTLVSSYDGRVWVEDRVPGDYHQGSRFVVLLPAADQDPKGS